MQKHAGDDDSDDVSPPQRNFEWGGSVITLLNEYILHSEVAMMMMMMMMMMMLDQVHDVQTIWSGYCASLQERLKPGHNVINDTMSLCHLRILNKLFLVFVLLFCLGSFCCCLFIVLFSAFDHQTIFVSKDCFSTYS